MSKIVQTAKKGPNLEALRLYRECLRTSKAFYWPNDDGKPWSVVLREAARKEFEQARNEKDPLVVARLLVVGRDCVQQVQNKFTDMEQAIKTRVDTTRNDRPNKSGF